MAAALRRGFIAVLLLTSCVTTRTPAPEPPPPPPVEAEPVVRELLDVGAQHSKFLDVSSGVATATAAIGGETGVRTVWFRFQITRPGEAAVTLVPYIGDPLSLALYNDAVILHPERNAPDIGSRPATSSPQTITSDLAKGVYYVKIASGPQAVQTDFVVTVTFKADAAPPTPKSTPKPAPKSPSKPAPKPVVVTSPPPTTPPPAPTPIPAPPPVLLTPERREAMPLPSGSTAMTDIGGDSGYRWRWYEVTLTRKGKLRVDVSADGAPVEVILYDANGKPVDKLDVERTATHSGRHPAGKMYIRVGPATNDAAARVTVELKVAVAPFIKEEK